MPLPAPVLDNRNFEQILSEAQERIVRYSHGEWTDFNESDPGVTLVQLFAWLTESLLYQMNRVPERNYVKFLELLNLKLDPACAARAVLTFTPKSQIDAFTNALAPKGAVPARTQIQAENPTGGDPLIFETKEGLSLIRRPLNAIQVFDGSTFRVIARDIADEGWEAVPNFQPFGWNPQPGSALYLGFSGLPDGTVPEQAKPLFPNRMRFRVFLPARAGERRALRCEADRPEATGSARAVWEYKRNEQEIHWRRLDVLDDKSQNFTRDGYITIEGPREIEGTKQGKLTGEDEAQLWIRCRLQKADFPGGVAPLIEIILPNSVDAENLTTYDNELLGESEGVPDQQFRMLHTPVVVQEKVKADRFDNEFRQRYPNLGELDSPVLELTTPSEKPEIWLRRDDFLASEADDPHYVFEANNGIIRFGDGQYGRVPVAGSQIVAVHYFSGGGAAGNVPRGTIITPRSNLSVVEAVTNYRKAEGGSDEQKIDDLKREAPGMIRGQGRAVTAEDFESLAKKVGNVSQAAAIAEFHPDYPDVRVPGAVTVAVIAETIDVPPRPTPELLDAVCRQLNEKRLITTELFVIEPEFVRLDIVATIGAEPSASFDLVKQEVRLAIQIHFNPLSEPVVKAREQERGFAAGQPDDDLPRLLGRDFLRTSLYNIILDVDNVKSVDRLRTDLPHEEITSNEKPFTVKNHQAIYAGDIDITVVPRPDQ